VAKWIQLNAAQLKAAEDNPPTPPEEALVDAETAAIPAPVEPAQLAENDPTYSEADVLPATELLAADLSVVGACRQMAWQPVATVGTVAPAEKLLLTKDMLSNIPGISAHGQPTASEHAEEPRKRARITADVAAGEEQGAAKQAATEGEGGERGDLLTTREHECPTWLIGRLIGRQCENLKRIQQGSQLVSLEVAKAAPSSKTRTLVLVRACGVVSRFAQTNAVTRTLPRKEKVALGHGSSSGPHSSPSDGTVHSPWRVYGVLAGGWVCVLCGSPHCSPHPLLTNRACPTLVTRRL
jgi:hypothetical protein